MTRIRSGKTVFISSSPVIQLSGKNEVMHVTTALRIFPAINEFKPASVIFDYDFLGNDLEKILRRFKSNAFYSKIKVYCYKQAWHTRTDSLLKTLGVDEFIYADDLKPAVAKTSATMTAINNMIENAVAGSMETAV